ncbi:MAG TPA: preprotein translocase subunit SecE [Anaerolineales bacterium]|nr:preprotein translocase subunit SecE [Anaerolineae bacterium]HIP88177.1 preprotein translocase subunit SecE [Anaerolineales bacterium]
MAKAKKENAIIRYFRETRAELAKVYWPSREETIRLTQIVLGVTVSMGLFLWLADIFFSWWLGGILEKDAWRIGLAAVVLVAATIAAVIVGRQEG